MRLIRPSFLIKEQESGLLGIYRQIEYAGRICYKSSDKITEDSAKPFVDRMVNSGHGAVLEHGTVYLIERWKKDTNIVPKYDYNPYSKVVIRNHEGETWKYITTNYRVLVENNYLDDLKYLCKPTEYHAKRVCVHFICDRGILAEFTRHRVCSFSAESTRYCNYSKNKFGNEVTFINPCWTLAPIAPEDFRGEHFLDALENTEKEYLYLIENGWKPQQARAILPNALKTELVMTGFVDDWWGEYLVIDKSTGLIDQRIHGKFYDELNNIDKDKYRVVEKGFFPLRCSSGAHPQAQELAIPLRGEFIKRKYYG